MTANPRPLVVAVTGGIASGKSTVTDRLAALGAPVIDADLVSRELVAPGQPALAEIAQRFGPSVIASDGTIDRRRLREVIFGSEEKRRELERVLHPRVRERMRELASAVPRDVPYLVLAIPLLAEVGRYDWIDRVVVVDTPREAQVARLVKRDGISPELAESMVAAQATRRQRLALADEVIRNDSTIEALVAQVDALHDRLANRAL